MLSWSSSRDNWERLVTAVVKKQQIWKLCHQQSRNTSICSSITSDDLSEQFLSFSGSNFEPFSAPSSPLFPPKNPSISQVNTAVSKSASSRPITRMLFSAWRRIRKPVDQDLVGIPGDLAIHLGLLKRFSRDELRVATRYYSEIIAGDVYRGWLADGSPVAVKRTLKKYQSIRFDNFRREVEINSIVGHPNVLNLLGFCITPNRLLLVYPLMVNGSVASCIWERDESKAPLNWPTRKGIALGAARGLAYLHEEICDKKVIHLDIKPANIFLDEDFEAVLGDFGLALVAENDASYVEVDTVCGTLGYISPEYYQTFRCSEKNDVYGYGAFLLALISGQKPQYWGGGCDLLLPSSVKYRSTLLICLLSTTCLILSRFKHHLLLV
ncbi:hypothetical protein ACS0TY_026881 [Phlomoides rotata]